MRLAARGAREKPGGGVEAIEDPEEADQLRRQARRVHGESLALAVLLTGVAMLARAFVAA